MAKNPRRAVTQSALETAERLLRSLRGPDEDIAAEAARLAELSRMRRMREPEGTPPYELAQSVSHWAWRMHRCRHFRYGEERHHSVRIT